MTEPRMGVEVLDMNGKSLGKIDYIIRDTWSGDIKKFIIYRKPPDKDFSFSPDDTSEITDNQIRLKIAID